MGLALSAHLNDPRQYVALSVDAFHTAMQYRPYVIGEDFYLLTLLRLVHRCTNDFITPIEQWNYLMGDFLDHLTGYLNTTGYDVDKLWRLEITPTTLIEGISRSLTVVYPYLQTIVEANPHCDGYSLIDYSPAGMLVEVWYANDDEQ